MSISKIFIPNFVCVLTNERYKTYHGRIFILLPGSCPRGVTLGHWGIPRGSNNFIFKHGHVAYQIDGDDKQNKMQGTFSSKGQTGDFWARSKGQIS